MTKQKNKNKVLSNALTGAALIAALTPTALDVVNVANPGMDTDDTAYAKNLAQGKAFVQMGVTTIDLQDSTGYVYPAGTTVARSSKDDSGASGSYYVHLFVGLTSNIGYGIVPESYVASTSTSIIDIDSNGKVVASSYLTDAGKYETFKPSQGGGIVQTDKGALKSNLDSASQKINSGLYTDASVANLQVQYNNALAVYNDTSVNQGQVDTANANLAASINALVEKPASVNKADLNATIDRTAVAYDNQASYTVESFAKFDAAFNTAVTVSNNANANQLQVDNANNSLSYTFNKLEIAQVVVNKDALQSAITNAQNQINSGKYTDESVSKVSQSISTATSVLNDTNAAQAEVDTATANLNNSVNSLVEKPVAANKAELEKAIAASNEAIKDPSKYTEDSVNNVKSAQSAANSILNNSNATQAEVDTATANLNTSVNNLVVKPIVVNKAELEKAIADSKEAIKDPSKYTEASVNDVKTYQSAAQSLLDNDKATQEQVNIATQNLKNAVSNLIEAEKPTPEANKKELEKATSIAKDKLAESEKYTVETVKDLQKSYDSAMKVLNDKKATQTQTDAATADVNSSINNLVVKPIVVNKTELEKAIVVAENKLKDESKYTDSSVAELKASVTKAKSALNDSKATQAQVDSLTKEVTSATNALKEKPVVSVDKKALETKLKDSKAVLDNPNGFTDASVANLKAEHDKANKVFNDKNATQSQIDSAVKSLDAAIKGLVKAPTTPEVVNKSELEKTVSSAKKELDNSSKYTDESVKVLKSEYEKANAVLKDSKATQDKVDSAKTDLAKAISGLKVKPVGPEKPNPGKPDPSKPTPGKPDPVKPTPSKPTPSKPSPNKPGQNNNQSKPEQKPEVVSEKPVQTTTDYVVVADDNLTFIANKHNVSLSDLLQANPSISNPDVIFEGQLLNIPTKVVESKPVTQEATTEVTKDVEVDKADKADKSSVTKEVKKDDAKTNDAKSENAKDKKSETPYSKSDKSKTETKKSDEDKSSTNMIGVGLGAGAAVAAGAGFYLSKRKKKGNGPSL